MFLSPTEIASGVSREPVSEPWAGLRLLAILPAHNEEGNVGPVIRDVRTHLPDADVLVIDDGSADGRSRRHGVAAQQCSRCP